MKMIGCTVLSNPKDMKIIVYQDSYLDDEMRSLLERQGFEIVEGVRVDKDLNPLPKNPPTLPLS